MIIYFLNCLFHCLLTLFHILKKILLFFFDYEYRLGKSARTVKHYYNNIHQALEKARKIEIIPYNPSDNCQLEKPKEYIPVIYNEEELNVFLKKIKSKQL